MNALAMLLAAAGLLGPAWAEPVRPPAPVVLFLGDSLTAGYGLGPEEAFPALVGELWRKRGLPYEARNGGVSGRTTAGLLENLDWSLAPEVKLVFLCIGANDGLRGLPTVQAEANISAAIKRIKAKGIPVALAGMKLPPNYGPAYTRSFEALFPRLAKKHKLKLLPFLLEDVGGKSELNLPDGVHPNAEGQRRIAERVAAFLDRERLLP